MSWWNKIIAGVGVLEIISWPDRGNVQGIEC